MSNRSAVRGTAAAGSPNRGHPAGDNHPHTTHHTPQPPRPPPPAPPAASCFAKEAVRQGRPEPPLPPFQPHPSPRLRQIKGGGLQPHQPSRPQEFLMGGKGGPLSEDDDLIGWRTLVFPLEEFLAVLPNVGDTFEEGVKLGP